MMYNYPFFSFPHFSRYSPYYPPHPSVVRPSTSKFKVNPTNIKKCDFKPEEKVETPKSKVQEKNFHKKVPAGFSFLNNFLHQEDRDESEEFFNILGLKLYNDDILLIGLIFFLYQEEVKDQYLFFALILLLLS